MYNNVPLSLENMNYKTKYKINNSVMDLTALTSSTKENLS